MDIIYLATFFVAFISSILSGIAGGGGGFVMAPYWLISGMTPAQGATTGAFMATGMSISSVAAFRKTDHFPKDKKLLFILSAVTFFASILGAIIVPKINIQAFKYMLAIITISALPLLFIKPNMKHRLSRYKGLGLGLAVVNSLCPHAHGVLQYVSFTDDRTPTASRGRAVNSAVHSICRARLLYLATCNGWIYWR